MVSVDVKVTHCPPSPRSLMVSVDVKVTHCLPSPRSLMVSVDVMVTHCLPSPRSLMVSVNVKRLPHTHTHISLKYNILYTCRRQSYKTIYMRHYIYITHTCTSISLMVSVDLKAPCKDSVWGPPSPCRPAGPPGCCPIPNTPYGFCGCKGHPLSPVPNKPLVSVDIKVPPCPPFPISLWFLWT